MWDQIKWDKTSVSFFSPNKSGFGKLQHALDRAKYSSYAMYISVLNLAFRKTIYKN